MCAEILRRSGCRFHTIWFEMQICQRANANRNRSHQASHTSFCDKCFADGISGKATGVNKPVWWVECSINGIRFSAGRTHCEISNCLQWSNDYALQSIHCWISEKIHGRACRQHPVSQSTKYSSQKSHGNIHSESVDAIGDQGLREIPMIEWIQTEKTNGRWNNGNSNAFLASVFYCISQWFKHSTNEYFISNSILWTLRCKKWIAKYFVAAVGMLAIQNLIWGNLISNKINETFS